MSGTWQQSAERENRQIRARAGRAIVQLLFTRTEGLSLERVRQLLRDGFLSCTDPLDRAVASLGVFELISAIVEIDTTLGRIGLHIQVSNGLAQLQTTAVKPASFAEVLRCEPTELADTISQNTLEVLSAVALYQPVTMSQLSAWFDADKRAHIDRLIDLGLVEKLRQAGGKIHLAITNEFLRNFGFENAGQLKVLLDDSARTRTLANQDRSGSCTAEGASQHAQILPPSDEHPPPPV